MGAYSPVPRLTEAEIAELVETVHVPVVAELARRGAPFVGVLFGGFMLTDDGPRVLEFNCRFGDPETQAILPRLEGDLLPALAAAAHGDLAGVELPASEQAAVTIVLASRDYPESGDAGTPIDGVEAAEATGALVFHAGTALHGSRLVTNGGRVLNVTGLGGSLAEARDCAYDAAGRIAFDGMQFRHDIAAFARV
jgi:phosphoribosylamine--glycine ligase